MGRSRIKAALFVLSAAALIAAPGAFSATPQEIYSDYADNGRLDGNVHARRSRAGAEERGSAGSTASRARAGLKPAVEEEIDNDVRRYGWRHDRRYAGRAVRPGGSDGGGGTSPVQSSGGLPFTGLDLSLIAAGALGLILLGAALRRVARQKA